jgi:hypothetical protein
MEMPVTSRRPPLPPLVCMPSPEYASFSVLRETPVPFSSHHFKKLKGYFRFSLSRIVPQNNPKYNHLAYSTARVSRITVTLICPG